MLPLWNIKTDCAYPATEDSTPEETKRLNAPVYQILSSSTSRVSGEYNMYLKNLADTPIAY